MPALDRSPTWLLSAALALAVACGSDPEKVDACTEAANELYAQRIEPILASDEPASCNQCHLSGVDLGVLVQGTPCQTMACLIEDGLVDLQSPDKSEVLRWIERATPDSELITEQVIEAEYDAFYDWIVQVAECGACSEARCGDGQTAGFCELEVDASELYDPARDPGGCDDKVLEEVFLNTIYVTRGRCYPCHFTSAKNPPPGATLWMVEQESCEASSLATMRNVIEQGYVESQDPEQSLLLLKPLSERDGGVEHGGHDKFTGEDVSYENFLYWLTRYAECAAASE